MDKTVIALSLQQKTNGVPLNPFRLTKGDIQAYRLEIRIFDGDKEFPYTTATTARMVFVSGKELITTNDNGVISETGISYDIGATEISFPGRVIAAVQLLDAAGKRLTVSRFLYDVLKDPLDTGQPLPTVPEIEQLNSYIAAAEQALEDVYGGVHISGTYATYADFIAAHPTGAAGELYLVDGSVYAWVDTTSEWLNVGLIADVRTQMSITSDGNGLKLKGDETSPADNKFYGVIGGAQGYHEIPKHMSITSDGDGLKLIGDGETPDNGKFYGVMGGDKGFFSPPAAAGIPYASYRKDDNTNVAVQNQLIQHGWGYIQGNGTNGLNKVIEFPVPFEDDTVNVIITPCGSALTSEGTPTNQSAFTSSAACIADKTGVSKTGFTVLLWGQDASSGLTSNRYFGFTWIAIGTKESVRTAATSGADRLYVGGVIRNAGSGWALINDTEHEPVNIIAVTQTTTYIEITYPVTTQVVSFNATVDETMLSAGYRVGASVGVSVTRLYIYDINHDLVNPANYINSQGNIWVNGFFIP